MTNQNPKFKITRTFETSPETMWKAWTTPEAFGKWFGPKGFGTAKVKAMDVRQGGMLHSCLTTPDGKEMWAKFIYRDVVPPTHISWEHSFSDKDGNITRHPLQPNWPLKLLTTIVLEDIGGKTSLTLTWVPLDATEVEVKAFADNLAGMEQGWNGTFEQLTEYLKSA